MSAFILRGINNKNRSLSQYTKSLIKDTDHRRQLKPPNDFSNLIEKVSKPPIGYTFDQSRRYAPVVLLTAAIETLNSPIGLSKLYEHYISSYDLQNEVDLKKAVHLTQVMRESTLKTITLNGVAKAINCLSALREATPQIIKDNIPQLPSRQLNSNNLEDFRNNGRELWDSIYDPFHDKLIDILNSNHPDMANYILDHHYSALLAAPTKDNPVGRVETSLIAIACLRAQGGVNSQLLSHAFGLEKAGQENYGWLASDIGAKWAIESTDSIVQEFNKSYAKL
ncbi:hypothetical protein WALSEDRAFT_37620 [Wallemia mellicola CBS 633.66]|uniref:Uncharacterized protein n=2 Tax=Wallemia mellicola TaxID=1708541 RepID=I4YDR8_WALMC|nr:hypothetical protein WALSEDRAFT_37620 [Wallemia mellicola CBS 633.66]TIB79186.1 hypothetical protein E3Q23_00289 [Wallemia mellicola]EIM22110.1 hypothetical protein WALSEDRAFT_37620 [Wallemia mellicola CBS 633.66]TIB97895.1 hypothetical protein E3Q18_02335 [Wallemia mellicola]TIC16049.1 hypothetical protein E3Q14_00038 [Wallemia mellicola]TIC17386.1 hypothetical protein E3Q15_00582 [Wallemia mellicola]|eukprot:XP_006957912.1 hypothetical protein WALSEDRAFT_37620 [Wallemia mellicola CBS 633.66]